MNLISFEYLILVIITGILYYIFPLKKRWIILLLASYIFYFSVSNILIVFLLLTIFSIYISALIISQINDRKIDSDLSIDEKKRIKTKNKKDKKIVLIITILMNVGILAVLKYNNLFIELFNSIASLDIGIKYFILPLGISYYTLQSLSYLIDVYFKKYKADKNLFKVMLFTSYFPQMIQGPIGRFNTLSEQLYAGNRFNYEKIKMGLILIGWGLIKKLVIADRVAIFVNSAYSTESTGLIMIIAAIFYTIQIYAEFSGCIDIVRGISELYGVKLDKNFNQPFFSRSIQEFWRRWHITLGTWLKDYIFYPISLSKVNLKLNRLMSKFKNKYFTTFILTIFPLFFVWFVNGIWHGASIKYIAYGMYYYVLMILGLLLSPLFIKVIKLLKIKTEVFSYRLFQTLRTFVIVTIGLVIFRAVSLGSAFDIVKSMFSINLDAPILEYGLGIADFLLIGLMIIVLFVVGLIKEKGVDIRRKVVEENLIFRWCVYLVIIFTILIFGVYGQGYDAGSFIYGGF